MKRLLTLVSVVLFGSAILFAGNPKLPTTEKFDGPVVTGQHTGPVVPTGSFVTNVVNTNVGNLRALLGAGHNVYRDAAGNIHVGSTEGTAGTYKVFYASSSDNGANFDVQSALSDAMDPRDDRYPAIILTPDGAANILYQERLGAISDPAALTNPDPLGVGAWTNQYVGANSPSMWITFVSAAPTQNTLAGSWAELNGVDPEVPWSGSRSVNSGATWSLLPTFPDTTFASAAGAYPIAVGDNGYMLLGINRDDWAFDTTITNWPQGNGGSYLGISESTDGGQTWTTLENAFGLTRSDYPTSTGMVDGVPHTIYWAGGTGWNVTGSFHVYNGRVYTVATFYAIDVTDHTLDGFGGVWLGSKPVGLGGTWTWAKASPAPVMVAGVLDGSGGGDAWYAEVSFSRADSRDVVVAYNDRGYSATGANLFVVVGSQDGGLSFDLGNIITIPCETLGLPNTGSVFMSNSPFFNADNMLDIIYLEDNAAVIFNNTIYHTPVDVTSLVSIGNNDPKPVNFVLNQNYPNPFNPTTTIDYTLKSKSVVSLKVYNLLGQEVRTLVGNTSQAANTYSVSWDGKDNTGNVVASGVYMYRLEAGSQVATRKMILVK